MFGLLSMKVCKTAQGPLKFYKRKNSHVSRGIKFLFQDYLLLTNSITSGACMGIGDLIQQEIEYQTKSLKKRYDWERAGRMLLVGALVGPAHHYYYVKLDKVIPDTTVKTVFMKVACDQLIASPLTILFFFYAMGYLEGKSISECHDEIYMKFKYVVMGDWLFWPPVQIINFWYLPTHLRVVYINIATAIFNVFMSYMKHYDKYSQTPEIDSDNNPSGTSVEDPPVSPLQDFILPDKNECLDKTCKPIK